MDGVLVLLQQPVEQLNQEDKPVDANDVVLKKGEEATETPYFTPHENLATGKRTVRVLLTNHCIDLHTLLS